MKPLTIFRNMMSTSLGSKSANFELSNYKFHKFDENLIPKTTTLNYVDAKKMFYDMSLIRSLQQEYSQLYKEKAIRGFCHLYSGQEACCVGMESSLTLDDSIITAYRAHGWAYTRGCTIREITAELFGKTTGTSKGRGGSMHIYGKNFYGGNGIVGAQVPLGTGVAFTHKYRDDGNVCVALYGDGAANQGQVFEAFNMAALWKLPVIFVCENNLYAMGTSTERSAYCTDYYTRGDYIPGIQVDGNCILSVREATKVAAEHCRSGKGPIILELVTYRYFGHSMSDPGTSYRSRDEVKIRRQETDPIKRFRNIITDSNLITNDELDSLVENAKLMVENGIEEAKNDPLPSVDTIGYYVYSDVLPNDKFIRGCSPYSTFKSE